MHNRAEVELAPGGERVPLTPAALRELQARAGRLEAALEPVRVAAQLRQLDQDSEAPTSMPDPELHLALARLARMRRALAYAEVEAPVGAIVVGCRVFIRHQDDEEVESYAIVAPGEGDPRAGRGDVARFRAVLEEYRKGKDVTRERLYLETIERVLAKVGKVVVDRGVGDRTLPLLPLNDLVRGNGQAAPQPQSLPAQPVQPPAQPQPQSTQQPGPTPVAKPSR